MRLFVALIAYFSVVRGTCTNSTIDFLNFHPPISGDLRSPCPALNALANHNIIPHDGRNLTVPMLVDAFRDSMNVSEDFTTFVGTAALSLAPDGGASGQFSLGDIQVHTTNAPAGAGMEHDGSLSRQDFALGGDSTSFSAVIFDEFLSYFGERDEIDLSVAAQARWGRIQSSRQSNSNFSYTPTDRLNSYIQSAIYMQSLKNTSTGKVPVNWIKIWFEEERLPYIEGWRPTQDPISGLSLLVDVLSLAMVTAEKEEDIELVA